MATLILVPLLGAVGSALIPGTILGVGIGAAVGQIVGGLVGAYIDNWLFGSSGQKQISEGPRLEDLRVTSSTEGQPIPRVYGRVRLGGVIIWATNFEEVRTAETQSSGGKGGGGGGSSTTVITYQYYCSFAIAICQGEITKIGTCWADGKIIDLSLYTYTLYKGTETQNPDPHIESKQPGTNNVPAYRGIAYIVFNRLPLEKFGNRIPQFNFEVFRSVDNFEKSVKAISMLPGTGDFTYSPTKYMKYTGYVYISGETVLFPMNSFMGKSVTDWTVSIDDLQDTLPNAQNVSLIVAWFGNDLRCGNCTIVPKVEDDNIYSHTTPTEWTVSSTDRWTASTPSLDNGFPAYGSTPDDKSVINAIQDMNARGLAVTFYPFIMMDIPAGNTLTDPYTGTTGQPTYPWRGRITCSPAPGVSGSPDKTATAATQVNSFVGTCTPAHFTISGESVLYSGPVEWSFRRFILHYAKLCAAAGGVNAFLIGTELRGLTWIRSAQFTHPFVTALKTLAAEVSAILPSAKIVYGSDWSEFTPYQTPDGEVDFHLDPLWSDTNIHAIGIDNYWPLSDWRQGSTHLDKLSGVRDIYDLDYLKSNIVGGEGYTWYYANDTNRNNQVRTTITDSVIGKPWMFRYKDIKNWWLNQHKNRAGGAEVGAFTSWVPQSKPFWFTEVGCGAVNFGSNQPNVFYDPKSSESFFPYFSSGARDDFIQRQHLRAFLEFYDTTHPGYIAGSNPTSTVYSAPMVDINRIYVYTWDARPFPLFPYGSRQWYWSDGANWPFGHWLTGRVGGGALASVIRSIMSDYNYTNYDVSGLTGFMDGFVVDRIMSLRDAIQPLEIAYFFDTFESEGIIKMRHRGALGSQLLLTADDLVEAGDGNLFEITRGQETELPLAAKLVFSDSSRDYQQTSVEARRLTVLSERISTANLPIVMRQSIAQPIADILLQENWVSREKVKTSLPPSKMFIEPTDVITLNVNGSSFRFRITSIADHNSRGIEGMQIDSSIYDYASAADRNSGKVPIVEVLQPISYFMDLPILSDSYTDYKGYFASYLNPLSGGVAYYRSPDASNYVLNTVATSKSTIGNTLFAFYNGPQDIYDNANQLIVKLSEGTLSSLSEEQMFGGGNTCAVRNSSGNWEVLQFKTAELIDINTYKLTNLLRGQLSTHLFMQAPVAAGAPFVVLNSTIVQPSMQLSEVNTTFNWKFGPVNKDISSESYISKSYAFNGMGLKCYSVCQAKLIKNSANNDLILTWVRRTRKGGDNWEVTEVPLGEDYESYEVEIYSGATLKRTVTVSTPTLTYTSAQQITDFGSNQTQIDVAIYQVNPYGRGHALRGFVYMSGAM